LKHKDGCGTDREDDGAGSLREPELPGVLTYGATQEEAVAKAEALALRVLAENSAAQG
jgi:predicted RNase H-like HicB family nuclease